MGGLTGWLPGEPGPYLRLVHRLGNGPVTCSFSLSLFSFAPSSLWEVDLFFLSLSLSLSLSQPISILKANQSECLSSLCVLWRFLPFYVPVLFVRDVTFCCALFFAVEVLLLFLFLACADKKAIGSTIQIQIQIHPHQKETGDYIRRAINERMEWGKHWDKTRGE